MPWQPSVSRPLFPICQVPADILGGGYELVVLLVLTEA